MKDIKEWGRRERKKKSGKGQKMEKMTNGEGKKERRREMKGQRMGRN